MKKRSPLFLLALIISFLFVQSLSITEAHAAELNKPIGRASFFADNSPRSVNACSHADKDIYINDKVGETCTHDIYNYIEVCNICGIVVAGGRTHIQKSTPTHTFTWITIGCNGVNHTYEYRCTKCGFVQQNMTRPCNGNCNELNSIDFIA